MRKTTKAYVMARASHVFKTQRCPICDNAMASYDRCFVCWLTKKQIDWLKIEIEAIRGLIGQRSKDGEAIVLYIGKLLVLSSVLEKLTLATRNGKAPTITSLGGRVGI